MQTTKWGPSAWVFVHQTALRYKPTYSKQYKELFTTLKDILPCKYCRLSYSQYIKELPVQDYLGSKNDMVRWSYLLHNKVNGKLREQGYVKYCDPPMKKAIDHYRKVEPDYYDFFGAIVFNYGGDDGMNPTAEQKKAYMRFFKLISELFGTDISIKSSDLKDRCSLITWYYTNYIDNVMECSECTLLKKFGKYVVRFENMRAKCGKVGNKGPTCRLKLYS